MSRNRKTRISAVVADITTAGTDAIVNAANNELWMGSGVAGAIKRAGGEAIEREAVSKGPIEVGGAVATGAGTLPHRAAIHAAAMGFQGGQMIPATAETVRRATTSALRVADDLGVTSIAFPALGTGVGGLDLAACARAMVGAVREHVATHPDCSLERVVFVVRNDEAKRVFEDAIRAHTPSS
jgi:O-acetyl-ADP-ribose deacetylase